MTASKIEKRNMKHYILSEPSGQEQAKRFKRKSSYSNQVDVIEMPPRPPRKIDFKITTKTGITQIMSKKRQKVSKSPSKNQRSGNKRRESSALKLTDQSVADYKNENSIDLSIKPIDESIDQDPRDNGSFLLLIENHMSV